MPKKSTAKKSKAAKSQSEESATYIDIGATQQDNLQKDKTLWLIVGIFSILLVVAWFAILKVTIAEQFKKIDFGQMSKEISESLARFDTEIKNQSATSTEITPEDISGIKSDLEEQLKNNLDSSLWPEHALNTLEITLNYPDNWLAIVKDNSSATLSDTQSSTAETFGRLTLNIKSNKQNYTLDNWLAKNKINPAGYLAETPVFKFTTSSNIAIYSKNPSATSSLDKIYYLNPSGAKIIEVKAVAQGDIDYYLPLINEIINTIK